MSEYKIQNYDVEDLQQKIFEIFLEFDRICKRHSLTYTLEGGTLLGAVLHKGFVPWDDDMDVVMLRKDYDEFCRIANEELAAPFVFVNMDMQEDYPYLYGKCFNTETLLKSAKTAHLNIPHGVYLDIFVMDNIKLFTKKMHSRLVSAIGTVKYIKHGVEKFHAKHLFYAPLFLLSIPQLNRLANRVMRHYDAEETEYIYPLCESTSEKPPLPKRLMTQLEPGIFNGFEVKIPTCHMWYLHKHYETPMELPPVERRHPTHEAVEIKL